MNKLIMLLSLIITLPCLAQERDLVAEMENNDLKIRQKPNTFGLLSDLLSEASIDEDTVYVVLDNPSQCPRCEAGITNFYYLLKANSAENKMVLLSVYDDAEISKKYNKEKGYTADYYAYTTEDELYKIFSFNSESMIGIYILKICPKSGIMITGGQYTQLSSKFVAQLRNKTEAISQFTYAQTEKDSEIEFSPIEPTAKQAKWKTETLPIMGYEKTHYISQVYGIPKFVDNRFFYSDMIGSGIMLFDNDGKQLNFKTLLQVDSTEKDRFIKLTPEDRETERKQGNLFYIALSANIIGKDKMAISYSLPELQYMSANEIGIFNHPTLLIRDLNTLKPDSMVDLDFDIFNSNYFLAHFTFDWFNNKAFMECEKLTWPMEGFGKAELEGHPDINSFDDRFYDTFNPIIVAFDTSTGKRAGLYGKLEDCQRKSKTGYFFYNPVYTHHERDFAYSNGFTGCIYVCDSTDISHPYKSYKAFDIDTANMAKADTAMYYKFEYGKLFDHDFSRFITTMQMDDKNIYCLTSYSQPRALFNPNDNYVYTIINRKTGKRKEYLLPHSEEFIPLGYGIRNDNGRFAPFALVKSNGKYFVNTFRL